MAGNGRWGNSGDGGLAVNATLAGPAGIAIAADGAGKVTLFIADFYNRRVRAVGPDGTIRDVSDGGDSFGAPTRVAFAPKGGWLYVADSSNDRLVILNIPKIAPSLVRVKPAPPTDVATAEEGARMTDAVVHEDDPRSLLAWTLSFLRPYRGQVVILIFLLLAQVALGALQPWPLKIVIDYVLGQHDLPEPFKGWMIGLTGGSRVELLVIFVIAGVLIQVVNQLVRGVRHAGPGRTSASGWSTTCATACSPISNRSACITTSPPAPATRSTAWTSIPTPSKISR